MVLDQELPLYVTASPALSTATQNVVVGQASPYNSFFGKGLVSMLTGLDHVVPFHVLAEPEVPTSMQKVLEI